MAQNGISVCDECHLKAESHWNGIDPAEGFSPEDLYAKIGSSYEIAEKASLDQLGGDGDGAEPE